MPAPGEYEAHCAGKSPREMASYFMSKPSAPHVPDGSPPYVFINRRFWADNFQYRSGVGPTEGATFTYYSYVRDLDAEVGHLYAGDIAYDTFAARVLSSPGFVLRFGVGGEMNDYGNIAYASFMIFLDEFPVHSQADNFGSLLHAWIAKPMSEEDAQVAYPDCPVHLDMNGKRDGCAHLEAGVVGARCSGEFGNNCASNTLGEAEVGLSTQEFVPSSKLSAKDREALKTPGRVLAARPEFAEAAVNAVLTRYLGWWRTGTFRPDYDIPAVRDALSRKFVADKFDLRALELEVLTSVLYIQAANRPAKHGVFDPIWSSGPTKLLYAEAWLDSLAQATGRKLGACDFRFGDADAIPGSFPKESSVDGFSYTQAARPMGGCLPRLRQYPTSRSPATGLLSAATRRTTLASVCPGAFEVEPSMTLVEVAKLVFAGVGRDPSPDELQAIVESMASTADGGCDPSLEPDCDLQALADSLCKSLFVSATYNYY